MSTSAWLILLAFAFGAIWHRTKKVKDKAVVISKRYCENADVQMLDGSVVLRAIWFKRNKQGNLSLWRKYSFEFASTGESRYSGMLIMVGEIVELVEMEPHRLH